MQKIWWGKDRGQRCVDTKVEGSVHVDEKVQANSTLLTGRSVLFVQPRICAREETAKGAKSPATEGDQSHGRLEMDKIRQTKQVPSRYVAD